MKPARKDVDETLFQQMPADVKELQKQSRKELRLKERRKFMERNKNDPLEVEQ